MFLLVCCPAGAEGGGELFRLFPEQSRFASACVAAGNANRSASAGVFGFTRPHSPSPPSIPTAFPPYMCVKVARSPWQAFRFSTSNGLSLFNVGARERRSFHVQQINTFVWRYIFGAFPSSSRTHTFYSSGVFAPRFNVNTCLPQILVKFLSNMLQIKNTFKIRVYVPAASLKIKYKGNNSHSVTGIWRPWQVAQVHTSIEVSYDSCI